MCQGTQPVWSYTTDGYTEGWGGEYFPVDEIGGIRLMQHVMLPLALEAQAYLGGDIFQA